MPQFQVRNPRIIGKKRQYEFIHSLFKLILKFIKYEFKSIEGQYVKLLSQASSFNVTQFWTFLIEIKNF